MSRSLDFSRRWQLARPLLAAYWLALAAGLILFAATQPDSEALGGVWLGAVAGSLLGNLLALCNLRTWLALLVALLASPFLVVLATPLAMQPELWTAFVPALACGFLLLGARATLAAFWFPAMIFTLTLIDRLDGDDVATALDGRAALVQGLIALAFLLVLAMFERRRISLWRAVGNVQHVAGTTTLLREPAGRGAARAGWSLAMVALTATLTAWIAPRLWQGDRLAGRTVGQRTTAAGSGAGTALPCCPVAVREPRARVREYLDVAHGVAHPAPRPGVTCQSCSGALVAGGIAMQPAGVTGSTATLIGNDPPAAGASAQPMVRAPSSVEPAVPMVPTPPAPVAAAAQAPTHAPTPAIAPPPSVALEQPTPVSPPASSAVAAPVQPALASPRPPSLGDDSLVQWLLSLLLVAGLLAAAMLGLRPLRRAVTLRHLRRPYWPESLPQRVSNLWQLALIGLRDAGVHAGTSELPEELARRAPVDEVGACASILARARHGLGLDDGDLEAMRAAAEATFTAARRQLGVVGRAASWLRWPLL